MPQNGRLYHCMNREPIGDALEPTCVREVNGRTDTFLFASPYISKTMAFSFDYHGTGEIIMNGAIDGTQDEFAIICDSVNTLSRPRHIQLFSFPDEGFTPLHPRARQCVSTRPIPFTETECLFVSQDVEDTMRYGLQIFSTEKTVEELLDDGFFEKFQAMPGTTEECLWQLVRDQGFCWENQVRNVNPNPKLLDLFSAVPYRQPVAAYKPPCL